MNDAPAKELHLDFHGRFIDALGIQMYQKPTAAIAELISNAWDADANNVEVTLPTALDPGAEIVIADDGHGMTFAECQDFYLKVGRNRRAGGKGTTKGGRPVLGRKGIGKFAGFGIAKKIIVDTTSGETGERTVFLLDLDKLRSDEFIEAGRHPVKVLAAQGPDDARKKNCGTKINLGALTLGRTPNAEGFAERMARRFQLAANAQSFKVKVNGIELSGIDVSKDVEFDFPADYQDGEKPEGLKIEGSEGVEKFGEQEVRWRIRFCKEPIGDAEFRGVSVFCGIKVAQTPFFFELSGGLSGQHGQQYLFGHVKADYLDQLGDDIITTERQRINWENPDAEWLLTWGQVRVKQLLSIWKERRSAVRQQQIDNKIAPFAPRLEKLQPSERKTVTSAIRKIATVSTLGDEEFVDLAMSLLTAWERGRLHELIERISGMSDDDAGIIVAVMGETQALTVLQMAEVIRTKIDLIAGLRKRVEARELENAIRDYIAEHPWLISPELEHYKKEVSLQKVLKEIANEIKLEENADFSKRIDLLLCHGDHLVLLEFMRPGLTIDRDHIQRFTHYVDEIRARVDINTGGPFRRVTGKIVADRLEMSKPGNRKAIERLATSDLYALDWEVLLTVAEAQYREYFAVMAARAPDDPRVREAVDGRAPEKAADR
ncbi:MAG: ATP-binding protein [Alphaproteobacteria bacterium]|nr:ATP-binding protein [Alphaproteobacteria bacterium]